MSESFPAATSDSIDWYGRGPFPLNALSEAVLVNGVGLEEHVAFKDMLQRLPAQYRPGPEFRASGVFRDPLDYLPEVGPVRLQQMDESCTAIQVVSVSMAGAEKLQGEEAVAFARDYNDRVAAAIAASPAPHRLRAFAHLPMQEPEAAGRELQRCVHELGFLGALINGMTADKFLDSPEFEPLLAAAEALDVPLYLHPALPPEAVLKTYHYTTEHLKPAAAFLLSMAGWSWHSEVGLHVLRLCLSGTLDRHRKLKLIIGHVGEMLPMMLARADILFSGLKLQRPVSAMVREQVWCSLSGMFTLPPLRCAIDTFGVDRVCWSVDYPYVWTAIAQARPFIRSLYDTMSEKDVHKIMHENARALLKL